MSVEAMNQQIEMPNNQIPNKKGEAARHLRIVPETNTYIDHVDFEQLAHYLGSKEKPTSIDVIVVTASQIGVLPLELDEVEKEVRENAIHDIEKAYEVYDVLFRQGAGNTPARRRLLNELTSDCDDSPIITALEEVALEAKESNYSKMIIDALRVARITMLLQEPDQAKLNELLKD